MESSELLPHLYPQSLQEIPQPPQNMWVRGTWPPPETKRLAVVGSRALSEYGRSACETLIAGLAGYPISIVSGLALGADTCAHTAALNAGLHTIAVPGSGLGTSVLYPRSNTGLAHDILEAGGLLLSEHPDDHKAMVHDFPSRNRIMVGLAHAVLVIEAGPQSGTLITARLAHEYNRDLLCVPHRITDPHSYGASLFLRLGATLVSEPTHIVEALGIATEKNQQQLLFLSGKAQRIVELLREPLPKEELLRRLRLPEAEALTELIALELKGVVEEKYGKWRRL